MPVGAGSVPGFGGAHDERRLTMAGRVGEPAGSSRGRTCSRPEGPTSGSSDACRAGVAGAPPPSRCRTTSTRTVARRSGAAGVERLYVHQAEALDARRRRPDDRHHRHRVRQVAVLQPARRSTCCAATAHARALYLYPTKALAQDQARALHALGLPGVRPAIYDGDTPRPERAAIRKRSNVVLTNPDMLHVGILPNHAAWGDVLRNLAVVVVDEAHVYRGVFGSHVGQRPAPAAAARVRPTAPTPRFLLASATIANPVELAERLTGLEDIALVDRDGSPHGRARRSRCGTRRCSTRRWASRALGARARQPSCSPTLVQRGARTICFMKSRKAVELIARETGGPAARRRRRRAGRPRRALPRRLHPGPAARARARGSSGGELLGVVTTDALELGIDIGALDAAIFVTFPGTVASLRQMWGRAGRRGRGLAVYIAGEDALDQFFCRHPDEFLDRPVEAAILDHETEQIHLAHLLCAAHEGPLDDSRRRVPRPALAGATPSSSSGDGRAARAPGRASPRASARTTRRRASRCAPPRPTRSRSSTPSRASCSARSRRRARTRPSTRARSTCTSGAPTRSRGLDLDSRRRPRWRRSPATATRSPRRRADTEIERLLDRREALGVHAVVRRGLGDRAGRSATSASGSPTTRRSTSTRSTSRRRRSRRRRSGTSCRTTCSAARSRSTRCSARSTRPSTRRSPCCRCWRCATAGTSAACRPTSTRRRAAPTIFIYDGHPGGVGITRRGFRAFERARRRRAPADRASAACKSGCPSCVQSPKCGNLNEPLPRAARAS